MEEFLLHIGWLTLSMSSIILLVLLFNKVLGGKFSAKSRYTVWAVVVLSLCIGTLLFKLPEFFTFEVEIPSFTEVASDVPEKLPTNDEIQESITDTPSAVIPVSPIKPAPSHNTNPNPGIVQPSEKQEMIVPTFPDIPAVEPVQIDMPSIIFAIWFVGAILYFAVSFTVYVRTTQKYTRAKKVCNAETAELYHAMCRKYQIKRIPSIYVCSEVGSPILYGYTKPTILIPDIKLSQNSMVGVLAHELTHYRRGDIWMKLICLFTESLYWFHPLVHLATARCNAEMELSCDEAVLVGMDEDVRRSYGKVMLEIVEHCSRKRSLLTTQFNPHKNAVKERILNILDMTKKKQGRAMIAFTLILCVTGTIIGCSVKDKETEEIDTRSQNESDVNKEPEIDNTIPSEDKESGYYLSITGTYQENSVYSEVYATYEIDLEKYTEHLKLPSTAAYPCSVCDLAEGKVYYSAAEESVIKDRLVMIDNIYVYDILSGEHRMLTTDGFFTCKMIKSGDRLYVTGSPLSTVGSYFGWIDFSSGEMIFPDLFEASGYTNFKDIAYSFQTNEMYLTWYDGKEQNRLNTEGGENRELAPSMLDVINMMTYEKKTLETFTDFRMELISPAQNGSKVFMYGTEAKVPIRLYENGKSEEYFYPGTALAVFDTDGDTLYFIRKTEKEIEGISHSALYSYDLTTEEVTELCEFPFYAKNMVMMKKEEESVRKTVIPDLQTYVRELVTYLHEPFEHGEAQYPDSILGLVYEYCFYNKDSLEGVTVNEETFGVAIDGEVFRTVAKSLFGDDFSVSGRNLVGGGYDEANDSYTTSYAKDYWGGDRYTIQWDSDVIIEEKDGKTIVTAMVGIDDEVYGIYVPFRPLVYTFTKVEAAGSYHYRLEEISKATESSSADASIGNDGSTTTYTFELTDHSEPDESKSTFTMVTPSSWVRSGELDILSETLTFSSGASESKKRMEVSQYNRLQILLSKEGAGIQNQLVVLDPDVVTGGITETGYKYIYYSEEIQNEDGERYTIYRFYLDPENGIAYLVSFLSFLDCDTADYFETVILPAVNSVKIGDAEQPTEQ